MTHHRPSYRRFILGSTALVAAALALPAHAQDADLPPPASSGSAEFAIDDPIAMGALVEADIRGETSMLLLVPAAGGMILDMDGEEITLLTPASKLYQSLLGKRAGDFIDEFDLLVIEVC